MKIKKSKQISLPFVLGISKISGIGVFSTHTIKKGEIINFETKSKMISKEEFSKMNNQERKWLRKHCLADEKGRRHIPINGSLVEYYLNHSKNNNVSINSDWDWYAITDIKTGEELTLNYKDIGYKTNYK